MGRLLVVTALLLGAMVVGAPGASASAPGRWQIQPCGQGLKALWMPRVEKFGTDLTCATDEERATVVKAAVDSGSPTRMMNVAIAFAQQISDKAVTPDSTCVVGAKAAIGDDPGTCVAT